MITVAKSFDAPIKLLFPQDLIENGLFAANKFAMLGLGMFPMEIHRSENRSLLV
jgi:Signal peptide peptidase